MGFTVDDCLKQSTFAPDVPAGFQPDGASACGLHESPAKGIRRPSGGSSLGLGLLVSAVAHAVLVIGLLCAHGMQEQQGPESVIMVEFADLSGPPGQGAAGGAGLAPVRQSAASNAVATAKSPQTPAAVNLVDKTSRQQAESSQTQVESRSALGIGTAGAEASSAAGGPGAGGSGGAGSGVGEATGGVSGGAGGGTGGGKVDSLPRIIEKVKPAYPEHARRMHKTGVVTLKFLVDAEGCVHQASVVEASPSGLFEESALAAIARWRFAPAMRQGRPVPTWLILPVRFTLEK